MQDTLPTTTDDSNGRWILRPTIKRAAMQAIPFPDYHDGRVGMAVYDLNLAQTARIVDAEADA
jgi:hypothetical protein